MLTPKQLDGMDYYDCEDSLELAQGYDHHDPSRFYRVVDSVLEEHGVPYEVYAAEFLTSNSPGLYNLYSWLGY